MKPQICSCTLRSLCMYFQMTLTCRACGDWEQQTSLISLESNGCIVINYSILRLLMQTRERTHSGPRMKISVCRVELKWQRGLKCTLSALRWEKVNAKDRMHLYYCEKWRCPFQQDLFVLGIQMSLPCFVHLFEMWNTSWKKVKGGKGPVQTVYWVLSSKILKLQYVRFSWYP